MISTLDAHIALDKLRECEQHQLWRWNKLQKRVKPKYKEHQTEENPCNDRYDFHSRLLRFVALLSPTKPQSITPDLASCNRFAVATAAGGQRNPCRVAKAYLLSGHKKPHDSLRHQTRRLQSHVASLRRRAFR